MNPLKHTSELCFESQPAIISVRPDITIVLSRFSKLLMQVMSVMVFERFWPQKLMMWSSCLLAGEVAAAHRVPN